MAAERINAAAVTAAVDVLDGDERRDLGEVAVTIGFTNASVKLLAPREMEELAAYLFAKLALEPMASSPAFAAHRVVLGALATELRGFAQAAGEPVGIHADLRAATSQAEERRIRARLADQAAAFDRHIDDVLLAQAAWRAHEDTERHPDDPYLHGVLISDTDLAERGIGAIEPDEEEPSDADQPTETDDPLAYL